MQPLGFLAYNEITYSYTGSIIMVLIENSCNQGQFFATTLSQVELELIRSLNDIKLDRFEHSYHWGAEPSALRFLQEYCEKYHHGFQKVGFTNA